LAAHRWIIRVRDADGQALVEYALIVSFVAVACAGTLGALGVGVDGLMNGIPGAL
jgi:Flp pilus assembly pilin Flp